MLDRAITLYVRRFASIAAVLAVISVPLIALQALALPSAAHPFDELARVLSNPGQARNDPAPLNIYAQLFTPMAFLSIAAALVFRFLMWGAVVAIVAAAYTGTRMTVAQAYRLALGRWIQQIIVGLAFSVMGMLAFTPAFIVYVLTVVAVVASVALKLVVLTVVLAVVGGLIILALFVTLGAVIYMSYELATVVLMTETANPVEAIAIALRRAFAPGMKRRTLVGGIVMILVSQAGTLPLAALAGIISVLTHLDILYFATLGVGTILLEGLLAAFVVVYAVDARVRREGYDLLAPERPLVPA